MSNIDLIEQNKENLPGLLETYEKELSNVEKLLEIKGKTLERANVEQSAYLFYFDSRKRELGTILKYCESRIEKIRGKLFKSYTETYNRALSDRAIDKYINNEEAYLSEYRLYLEIYELYEKYDAVVEAFKSRSYALNNITRLRVASLEDITL